uniref:Reverse transcriptase domain-containing protein n=1 Tax=Myripristis murdjan TaxID=586833 RepID=A0A667YPA7_9TELE
MNILDSFALIQHVTEATHRHGNTLDLVITTGLNIGNVSVLELPISDHHCVLFNATLTLTKTKREYLVTKRFLGDEAEANFANLMRSFEPHSGDCTLNDMVKQFNNALSAALNTVAPLKVKKKFTDRISPWLNNNSVKKAKRACRAAERKWRKTKLTVHCNIYKEALNTYNKEVRLARMNYFSKIITENSGNSRILFSTIDQLLNTAPTTPQISASRCEELALFFNNKITSIRTTIPVNPYTNANAGDLRKFCKNNATMGKFNSITLSELCKTVNECNSTTSCVDPVPTAFFKRVFNSVSGHVLAIINMSLQTGIFPDEFKTAVVKPLLKKPNLDSNALSSYRPISNIPFISKILEKIVAVQINAFLKENNILEEFQSGFRKHHSTETALAKIVSDLRLNYDENKVSILILLDLSAAFDTIDHDILINRLEKLVGLSDCVLHWFKTYIKGRKFYVRLGDHVSGEQDNCYGVPQGSCLGPLLFSLYMLPLGDIIRRHNVCFHSYADDTQLYISAEPNDATAINPITTCLMAVNKWMSDNFLKLNEDKTEILLVGPKTKREMLSINLGKLASRIKSEVTSLGIVLDPDLSFKS